MVTMPRKLVEILIKNSDFCLIERVLSVYGTMKIYVYMLTFVHFPSPEKFPVLPSLWQRILMMHMAKTVHICMASFGDRKT